jgi:hypothetical protein
MALLVVLLACAGEQKDFESSSAFHSSVKQAGWEKLGSFGSLKWPARITMDKRAQDEIEFTTSAGVPHRYPGYTGYELRVVQLLGADGTKGTFVFRSAKKR